MDTCDKFIDEDWIAQISARYSNDPDNFCGKWFKILP
jgi:hypothetical protein